MIFKANSETKRQETPAAAACERADRRLFLFGLPLVGLTLFAAKSTKGALTDTGEAERTQSDREPQYRETELVRRYYQRARF